MVSNLTFVACSILAGFVLLDVRLALFCVCFGARCA